MDRNPIGLSMRAFIVWPSDAYQWLSRSKILLVRIEVLTKLSLLLLKAKKKKLRMIVEMLRLNAYVDANDFALILMTSQNDKNFNKIYPFSFSIYYELGSRMRQSIRRNSNALCCMPGQKQRNCARRFFLRQKAFIEIILAKLCRTVAWSIRKDDSLGKPLGVSAASTGVSKAGNMVGIGTLSCLEESRNTGSSIGSYRVMGSQYLAADEVVTRRQETIPTPAKGEVHGINVFEALPVGNFAMVVVTLPSKINRHQSLEISEIVWSFVASIETEDHRLTLPDSTGFADASRTKRIDGDSTLDFSLSVHIDATRCYATRRDAMRRDATLRYATRRGSVFTMERVESKEDIIPGHPRCDDKSRHSIPIKKYSQLLLRRGYKCQTISEHPMCYYLQSHWKRSTTDICVSKGTLLPLSLLLYYSTARCDAEDSMTRRNGSLVLHSRKESIKTRLRYHPCIGRLENVGIIFFEAEFRINSSCRIHMGSSLAIMRSLYCTEYVAQNIEHESLSQSVSSYYKTDEK
ncbi:LOW QUALITY PROTEIN: hypothetical protein V1478_006912 [Vespula squamosa]|uniref:Uncharacterized protein n=1 Tax=Vespula squamosa TaxID=30214 RepID=A0ABD2B1Q5_VESSQ